MRAEDFYESLKDGLRYLGLQFGEMSEAYVYVDGNSVCMAYQDRVAYVELPTRAVFERDVLGKGGT